MSLDTVLKIGKALRSSANGMKYFKYVKPCPKDGKRNQVLRLSIPVSDDFQMDFENIKIVPENEENQLYYMTFKTSNSDSITKYLFGDIYYSQTTKIDKQGEVVELKEGGYYRLENPTHTNPAFRKCSFDRGENDYQNLLKDIKASGKEVDRMFIVHFRDAFEANIEKIEGILKNSSSVIQYFSDSQDISFLEFLNDEQLLKEYSIKTAIQQMNSKALKTFLGDDYDLDNLSFIQKEKLFLVKNGEVFIHFDFNGKPWYEFEEDFYWARKKMLSDFADSSENGIILKKTLYKTLCSGDDSNDIQFPNFSLDSKHKAKAFGDLEFQDLFYAIDYSERGIMNISNTEIKIIVLPIGDNLKAKDYEDFLEKRQESHIVDANNENSNEFEDSLFSGFEKEEEVNITAFDVIFSKKGGKMPDVDLIEISGIEKSSLKNTKNRINLIAQKLLKEKEILLSSKVYPLSIEKAFYNLLANYYSNDNKNSISQKVSPLYKTHILKVLPSIYNQNYFEDKIILRQFIQNIEYLVRVGSKHTLFLNEVALKSVLNKYNQLKYDLKFILSIQNSKNDKFMEIVNSDSYKIGLLLGKLAKDISQKINSFEKSYVGNLTRRISRLDDFIRLKNDILQKLTNHVETKFFYKTSYELDQLIKDFDTNSYDKDLVAFGFLESYFKPFEAKN
jgi:hypothetical protein